MPMLAINVMLLVIPVFLVSIDLVIVLAMDLEVESKV